MGSHTVRQTSVLSLLMILLMLSAALLLGSRARSASAIQSELSDHLLRLHIVANSDSTADQEVKLLIRDAILATYSDAFTAAADKAEAVRLADSLLPDAEALANEILEEHGFSDRASASLEHCAFPEKTYGGYTFPAGEYDALRITIGAAAGHNWWCVLYPPLCFTELSCGELPQSSKELLERNLSPKAYQSLTAPSSVCPADESSSAESAGLTASTDSTDLSSASANSVKSNHSIDSVPEKSALQLRFRLFPFLNRLFSGNDETSF